MTFTTEIALDVDVEILSGHPPTRARYGAHPVEGDPGEVEIAVWLVGRAGERLDLTTHLPTEVRDALEAEALERLEEG